MKLFLTSLQRFDATDQPDLFDSIIDLPDEINAVVGDTLQVYYNAMYTTVYSFYTRVSCSIGQNYLRYFEVTPSAAGDYSFTISVVDASGTTVASKTSNLKVRFAVQQPSSMHEFWTVGDSLVNNSTWTNEMVRRLTGTGGTPAGNGFGNIVNHREGNSGKDWNWYVNSEDSPFVYSGVLDFEQYRVDNGLAIPKSMYILLTWNGMGSYRDQSQWDLWDNDVYTFIAGVQADFPSCDIILMSPQLPSLTGGLGASYGATGIGYSDLFTQFINCKKQGQIYTRIESEIEKVSHIMTALQVDSFYNMPYQNKSVNVRNAVETEIIGTNGVHPSDSGYNQIADAAYRDFINNYCQ